MPAIRFRVPSCSRGVTLIEIMLVIAIMMILMGLIMTVIGGIRKRAKEHATRLLLDGIASDMSRYHMEFDDYPYDSENAPKADGSVNLTKNSVDNYDDFLDNGGIFLQMNGADGSGVIKNANTPYEKRLEPYLKLQPENVRKAGTTMIIMDFFYRPIRYFNAQVYLRSCPVNTGTDKMHNQKVDLWSFGESESNPEDDIKNWK